MKRKISLPAAILIAFAAAFAAFAATYFVMGGLTVSPEKEHARLYAEAERLISASFVGEADGEDISDYAVAGMVAALDDKWSYYISPRELQAYYMHVANSYMGIGVVFSYYDGEVIISSVYEVSPAAEAGIEVGSALISVNGKSAAGLSTTEAKELVQKCSEEDGQLVFLLRLPSGEEKEYTLTEGTVENEPVGSFMLDSGYGYIQVLNFNYRSADGIISACDELIGAGAEGLIFDLRNNPGGQVSELTAALDHLMPEGVIFVSQHKGAQPEEIRSDAACIDLPMAVLVNAESYSSAEYFAGLLQEAGRAIVVGEKTSGKGRAQSTLELSNGGALHISTMEYYLPSGRSLAETGVAPDVKAQLSEEAAQDLYYGLLPVDEDSQLIAAEKALAKRAASGISK